MERLCVFPEDIVALTGRGLRYSQNVLKHLKILHNKQKHQYVSKKELATYLGLDENNIRLK